VDAEDADLSSLSPLLTTPSGDREELVGVRDLVRRARSGRKREWLWANNRWDRRDVLLVFETCLFFLRQG
jgi:hypothetical protein